jgi:cytochrome P450
MLDGFVGSGGFDMIRDFAAQMPMRVIGMLLGVPESDQQMLRESIDDGLKLESGVMPTAEELAKRGADVAQGNIAEYVDWRVDHPSDDLMTDLLTAEFDDHTGERRRLSRDEVLGYCRLLASAGNETTTRLIGWATKVLADNPGERRRLVENPSLIPSAIEEVLRYETPTPALSRYVTREVHVHGGVVPEGSAMVMLTSSANRDERKFPDADRFDVGRRIDHHLGFGYGIHFCLGASLARLEGRVALDEIIKRFPEWDVDLSRSTAARTSTVRGWESLAVTLP